MTHIFTLTKQTFISVFNKTISEYIGDYDVLCSMSDIINVYETDDNELLFVKNTDHIKVFKNPLREIIHVIATNKTECDNFITTVTNKIKNK